MDLFEMVKNMTKDEGVTLLSQSNQQLRKAIIDLLEAFDGEDPYHVQLLTDEFHEKLRHLRRMII